MSALTASRDLPAGWFTVRPCKNSGCEQEVVGYLEENTGNSIYVHVADGTLEKQCSAPPFEPSDGEVRASTDPEFLRRVLTGLRISLDQAQLALGNPACPADVLADYRERVSAEWQPASMITPWSYFVAGLASRSDNTETEWQKMRASKSERILMALAANPHTPAPILDSLLPLSSFNIQDRLARNPAIDVDKFVQATLDRLAASQHQVREYLNAASFIGTVLGTQDLTPEQRASILQRVCDAQPGWNETCSRQGDIAFIFFLEKEDRGRFPGDVLDWMIRTVANVASWQPGEMKDYLRDLVNPRHRVPTATLEWLYRRLTGTNSEAEWSAWNAETVVRLLRHPNNSPEILMEACSHPDRRIREVAASHRKCPDEGKVLATVLGWDKSSGGNHE